MPPTTLKLPAELKQRIQAIVKQTGQSAHAFMVEAIEREISRAEQHQSFLADGHAGLDDARRTSLAFSLDDVAAHYRARVAGKRVPALKARKWRR